MKLTLQWLHLSASSFSLFWSHPMACELLVPQPGIEPGPQQWEYRILITGPPGNSQFSSPLYRVGFSAFTLGTWLQLSGVPSTWEGRVECSAVVRDDIRAGMIYCVNDWGSFLWSFLWIRRLLEAGREKGKSLGVRLIWLSPGFATSLLCDYVWLLTLSEHLFLPV